MAASESDERTREEPSYQGLIHTWPDHEPDLGQCMDQKKLPVRLQQVYSRLQQGRNTAVLQQWAACHAVASSYIRAMHA